MQHRIDINDEKGGITDEMVEVKKIRLVGLYMILNSKESSESLIPLEKYMEMIDMKLPKNIRIGSADYEVSINKRLASRDGAWGFIDYGSSTIEIEDGISLSKSREALAHEMAHAIFHEAGIRDLEQEEKYVTAIGPVLAMVLRDNDFTFMRDEGKKMKSVYGVYLTEADSSEPAN